MKTVTKQLSAAVIVLSVTALGAVFFYRNTPPPKEDPVTVETEAPVHYSEFSESELQAEAESLLNEQKTSDPGDKKALEKEYGPLDWVNESLCFDEDGNFYYLTDGRLSLEMTAKQVADYGKEQLLSDCKGGGGE